MMQLFPADAKERLEFDKILALLKNFCRTEGAHQQLLDIRIHTQLAYIQQALDEVEEAVLQHHTGQQIPLHATAPLNKTLQLLALQDATLDASQFLSIKKLALAIRDLSSWMKNHGSLYPHTFRIVKDVVYEKEIASSITAVMDDAGLVLDHASAELQKLRTQIASVRNQSRKVFEQVLRRLGKQGYLADISEGFLNGRRTVAVLAEYKRMVPGIFHGESDSQKTVFIEPEETISLNNELQSLIHQEGKEIQRILKSLTATLATYVATLQQWWDTLGTIDFVQAKAQLALMMHAEKPVLSAHPSLNLVKAYHPLLLLHNKASQKDTIPTQLSLNRKDRILIISGPNAGGKTVTMKTVGLLQLMVQAGMLIPADSRSEVGVYKQLMIHIGDTQSIEHELSTYSAHLRDMKHFTDFANGKSLFFIDELGSGSDPQLGGAFAEAIVEALAAKNAQGIITTHYLNLKVMAGKVPGIQNAAMTFDEQRLLPLYQLSVGKPGSSYTFAIAQRSNLSPEIISRARNIADRGHLRLDKLLLQTEQKELLLQEKEAELQKAIKANQALQTSFEALIDKEKRQQQEATLKLQNKIKKEELDYLREMERKFKQIIQDWKKADNKQQVIADAEKVLFRKKQVSGNVAIAKKADRNYETIGGVPQLGDFVRSKTTHQVGKLIEIKEKRSVVQIGKLPFQVSLEDWVVVKKKEEPIKEQKAHKKEKATRATKD